MQENSLHKYGIVRIETGPDDQRADFSLGTGSNNRRQHAFVKTVLDHLPLAARTEAIAEVASSLGVGLGPDSAARAAPDEKLLQTGKPTRPTADRRSNEVERGPGS
eukprot:4441492-Pyramimonas_sp.AAC.1